MAALSSSHCQFAGTGCTNEERFSILVILVVLSVTCIGYGIYQNQGCTPSAPRAARAVLRLSLMSQLLCFSVILSRFFEVLHGWVTSWLFIAVCIVVFIGIFASISHLLIVPLVFMEFKMSIAYM
jgi:hypothetical protein